MTQEQLEAKHRERIARSIHDESVNAMRERVAATWPLSPVVQRALAGRLPVKEYAR